MLPHVALFLPLYILICNVLFSAYVASIWNSNVSRNIQYVTEYFTSGRSGAFMYFTHDKRFIVKTVTKREHRILCTLLPHYAAHVEHQETTLLTRICGLHAVRLTEEQRFISFVVLQHICFQNGSNQAVHCMYDLKGSSFARSAQSASSGSSDVKPEAYEIPRPNIIGFHGDQEIQSNFIEPPPSNNFFTTSPSVSLHDHYRFFTQQHTSSQSSTEMSTWNMEVQHYKDIDLIHHGKIYIGKAAKMYLAKVLAVDVTYLYGQSLMDFSLVVALYFVQTCTVTESTMKNKPLGTIQGIPGLFRGKRCHVYFGVVDLLQRFDHIKQLEHWCKSIILQVPDTKLSSVPSHIYCERFLINVLEHFE